MYLLVESLTCKELVTALPQLEAWAFITSPRLCPFRYPTSPRCSWVQFDALALAQENSMPLHVILGNDFDIHFSLGKGKAVQPVLNKGRGVLALGQCTCR